MSEQPVQGVVSTIAAKCKRCYNCVRSCPAKAIRVQSGQAYVMAERCIGCGNCIRVCAQNAKQVQSAVEEVEELLAGDEPVVALIAPSYPGAFEALDAGHFVAGMRELGFDKVMEVGFGAEMVAAAYMRLLKERPTGTIISTACPALVSYVEKYMPELVPMLAPIVSPMVALARAVKQELAPGAPVVFIGPCIAKKAERLDPAVAGVVDSVLSFKGLDELWQKRGIDGATLPPSVADDPLPYLGAVFPVSGGLLKTAAIEADVLDDSILVVEGPDRCLAALRQLADGTVAPRLVDALFCEGCIAGPAYPDNLSLLARKERVTAHVRSLQGLERQVTQSLKQLSGVDVSRGFGPQLLQSPQPTETEIRDILAKTSKLTPADELNCGACGYPTCREKAIAVYQGLAEPEMCLPYLIDQLQVNLDQITRSREELSRTREVAMRAQQLASMGELAADIGQQISNPLARLVLFSQLLRDNMPDDDVRREDVASIMAEALHCREVLASLQGFARQREPQWEETQVSAIVARALEELQPRLRRAGLQVEQQLAGDLPPVVADPAQLAQVLVNVLTNSLEAVGADGHITVSARPTEDRRTVEVQIRDNGHGIPSQLMDRIFQPFVTTKEDLRGAGLGLPVAHGIMQAHGGEILVASTPGEGTTVTLRLRAEAGPKAGAEGAKVMVVDDDPDFLEQHRLILESAGFKVVVAERSDEAIEVANREIPDAFLLDMMMERTDSGARLARTLRRDPRFRKSPIIMLTSVVHDMGFDFHRNPQAVLEWMKADAWFDKPAPIAELRDKIRELLQAPADEQVGRKLPGT
ncbi:MAG: response regulator [Armatimonadetes bacterium]|nr:response regulator [Armatimonadota bacterium]